MWIPQPFLFTLQRVAVSKMQFKIEPLELLDFVRSHLPAHTGLGKQTQCFALIPSIGGESCEVQQCIAIRLELKRPAADLFPRLPCVPISLRYSQES